MAIRLLHIEAKIDVDTFDLLNKAMVISGFSSINSFAIYAAVERAKQVL